METELIQEILFTATKKNKDQLIQLKKLIQEELAFQRKTEYNSYRREFKKKNNADDQRKYRKENNNKRVQCIICDKELNLSGVTMHNRGKLHMKKVEELGELKPKPHITKINNID
jgi:hypothetical protein